ncbi:MAG: hypothetical protein AB2793_16545, partial [Candidatus Thiodiazotropha sp.]
MQNNAQQHDGWVGKALSIAVLSMFSSIGLVGCQDGVSTETLQPTTVTTSTYTGPAARTSDIQGFRISVWEPLRGENRCGSCHNTGGQAPQFVREDDVNQAYGAANP